MKDTAFFDYSAGGTFSYPQVSPDGSTLLIPVAPGRLGPEYWAVPENGGAPRDITTEAADQNGARWSPDGKSILYLSMASGTQGPARGRAYAAARRGSSFSQQTWGW